MCFIEERKYWSQVLLSVKHQRVEDLQQQVTRHLEELANVHLSNSDIFGYLSRRSRELDRDTMKLACQGSVDSIWPRLRPYSRDHSYAGMDRCNSICGIAWFRRQFSKAREPDKAAITGFHDTIAEHWKVPDQR